MARYDVQRDLEAAIPAESKAQRRMMAIAKNAPGKLYKRNRGALSMSKQQLSKYASTKENGLTHRKGGKR